MSWYKQAKEVEKRKGYFDWSLQCCGQPENRRKDPYKANEKVEEEED